VYRHPADEEEVKPHRARQSRRIMTDAAAFFRTTGLRRNNV